MDSARFVRAAAVTAVAIVVVDQVSKAIVRQTIEPGASVTVIDGVLRLVNTRNPGIAGGRLADAGVGVIIALSLLALGGMLLAIRRLGTSGWLWLPVGLILGGGLGNLIDRLHSGAVTDFIVVGHRGAANLADQAIMLGVVALFVAIWRSGRAQRAVDVPT